MQLAHCNPQLKTETGNASLRLIRWRPSEPTVGISRTETQPSGPVHSPHKLQLLLHLLYALHLHRQLHTRAPTLLHRLSLPLQT